MLSSYVGPAIGAALRFERGWRVLYVTMKVNGCDVYARYGMVWYAKDHAVAYYREMRGSI
jgi:hypothetical protein